MNYSNLMDVVNARIRANGRREITGDVLNDVLRAMVVELGAGYQLGGTIRPGDKPKDEDLRVAYLAVEPGMYLYAGGFEVTELSLITYGAEWYMYPLGVPFGSQIAEDIAAAVEAEKTRAMAAETANAAAIASEEDAREQADNTLQGNITAEKTAREAADDALAAKVTAEEAARKSADATLQANINTEERERKAADQTLQANIDKKVSKDDGTWLENFMPRIMLNGDGTTSAPTVGDNLVADYENTSYYLGKYGGVVTPFDEESVHGRVVQVKDLGDNKLYVTAIFNDGANFSDNYANSLYEIVLNFAANGSFANGTYTANVLAKTFTLHLNAGTGVFEETAEAVADVITDKGIIFQLEEDLGDESKYTYPFVYGNFTIGGTLYFGKFDDEDGSIVTYEVYTNDMSYDKFDDYFVRQRDIEDLKTQAANQTAFGWGDHAKAGYTKAFIINLSVSGSGENPFVVDKTHDEVAAALAANNLILLKANLPDHSVIYSLTWAENYPTEGIMLRFVYMDKANLATTIELLFSYQEGVNVTVSGVLLATDEQVEAKQDKLVSGTNIKTINGESILGSGDLKAGGLATIKAGTGSMSEVFNGIAPEAASGKKSHAEGSFTTASGDLGAHAEGNLTNASGQSSHAEGYATDASRQSSHAEGSFTTASGESSHSEGQATTANGANSHAEGYQTTADGPNSHAEGHNNVPDGAAIHQVGIGEEDTPKDAHRITYDGKHYILGIGGFDGTKATANLTNEKDLATVINEYETRIAALERALAATKN